MKINSQFQFGLQNKLFRSTKQLFSHFALFFLFLSVSTYFARIVAVNDQLLPGTPDKLRPIERSQLTRNLGGRW